MSGAHECEMVKQWERDRARESKKKKSDEVIRGDLQWTSVARELQHASLHCCNCRLSERTTNAMAIITAKADRQTDTTELFEIEFRRKRAAFPREFSNDDSVVSRNQFGYKWLSIDAHNSSVCIPSHSCCCYSSSSSIGGSICLFTCHIW